MRNEELTKQYRNMLMFLEERKHKKSSNSDILHPIIASLEEKIEELNSIDEAELSDVEYGFYIDMLDMYCKELSDSGIKCDFILNNKKSKDEIPEKNGDITTSKKSSGLLGYIVLFVLILSFVIIGKNGYETYKLKSDAKAGNPKAQFDLAVNYRSGENGFTIDSYESEKWMKASANNGYAPAQHNIGLLYEQSWRRTHVGFDEAVSWYKRAAEQGYKPSIEKLEELQNEFPELFKMSKNS